MVVAAIAANFLALTARADVYGPYTMTKIWTYTDFGGGDVVFLVTGSALPSACSAGFWLPASSAGFKNSYAALMSVYLATQSVPVSADPTT